MPISHHAQLPLIRAAQPADRAALERVEAESWPPGTRPDAADPKPWWARVCLEDTLAALVAVTAAGEILGYAAVVPRTGLATNRHVARLAALAVHPHHVGRGIGSALLAAVERAVRARGMHKIVLTVLGSNLRAQRLYARAGYVEEGRLRGEFVLDGTAVDDVWMSRWVMADESPPPRDS